MPSFKLDTSYKLSGSTWTAHRSGERTYYLNADTGETSWNRPAVWPKNITRESSAADTQRQFDKVRRRSVATERTVGAWTEHRDPNTDKTFLHHPGTGVSQWIRPQSDFGDGRLKGFKIVDDGEGGYWNALLGEERFFDRTVLGSLERFPTRSNRNVLGEASG